MKKLPKKLTDYNFDKLFELKPNCRSSVLVYNKSNNNHCEKEIYRSYSCFLDTPEFDKEVKKSYMFLNKNEKVPEEFLMFVDFAKNIDERYNQMVVNYYNSNDFIELHSDCTSKFISPESPILTVNLNESNDESKERDFIMVDKQSELKSSFKLKNNHFFVIENNQSHRHMVKEGKEKRISLTFRMIQV